MKPSSFALFSLIALTSNSWAIVLENDVTFYLFTNKNRQKFVQIDHEYLNVSRNGVIDILVHGWQESRLVKWYDDLKNALLSRPDKNCTVIQVDWAKTASQFYPLAALETPQVGKTVNNEKIEYAPVTNNITLTGDIIGDFILNLVTNRGVPISNFHVIGHSLGAHVASFAAKRLLKSSLKLSRITGLDPAGVFFEGFIFSDRYRLNRNDAEIVVVVHTDGGKFGYLSPCGTIDIFPNGGVAIQPGCPDFSGGANILFCSHQRSHQFYINALENRNSFVGTKCSNYALYLLRGCDQNRQLDLGVDLTLEDEGDYYLTTNPKIPYGQGPRNCSPKTAK